MQYNPPEYRSEKHRCEMHMPTCPKNAQATSQVFTVPHKYAKRATNVHHGGHTLKQGYLQESAELSETTSPTLLSSSLSVSSQAPSQSNCIAPGTLLSVAQLVHDTSPKHPAALDVVNGQTAKLLTHLRLLIGRMLLWRRYAPQREPSGTALACIR